MQHTCTRHAAWDPHTCLSPASLTSHVVCFITNQFNQIIRKEVSPGVKYTQILTHSHTLALAKSPHAHHPGGNPGANLKSISLRCHPILVAFVWELTK